ncbi:hypothetical protein P2318_03730 [Myxococcaceae bacterium GXIMD 01537]
MDPISRKLGQALLDHHRSVTKLHPPGSKLMVDNYVIAYGTLCARANVPLGILPIIGRYLLPIAEWCAYAPYPALNSLAVNEKTGIPGDGYDEAGGFMIIHWPAEVERCIRFTGYPAKIP